MRDVELLELSLPDKGIPSISALLWPKLPDASHYHLSYLLIIQKIITALMSVFAIRRFAVADVGTLNSPNNEALVLPALLLEVLIVQLKRVFPHTS
jgi:hypothetical protein